MFCVISVDVYHADVLFQSRHPYEQADGGSKLPEGSAKHPARKHRGPETRQRDLRPTELMTSNRDSF